MYASMFEQLCVHTCVHMCVICIHICSVRVCFICRVYVSECVCVCMPFYAHAALMTANKPETVIPCWW